MRERLAKLGVAMRVRPGAELPKFIADESARWRRVIDENKLKLEN